MKLLKSVATPLWTKSEIMWRRKVFKATYKPIQPVQTITVSHKIAKNYFQQIGPLAYLFYKSRCISVGVSDGSLLLTCFSLFLYNVKYK